MTSNPASKAKVERLTTQGCAVEVGEPAIVHALQGVRVSLESTRFYESLASFRGFDESGIRVLAKRLERLRKGKPAWTEPDPVAEEEEPECPPAEMSQ